MTQPGDKQQRELLDKAITALSGEYVEKPDDAGEEWNAAVGYCIGKLRVMQEQLSTPSATLTIDPEVLALAKSMKGKSTRQPVYVTAQLAREIIRLSDGGAKNP